MGVLRKCNTCNLEANTVEDLKLFAATGSSNKYGKRNVCRKCDSIRRSQQARDNKVRAIKSKDSKCLSCGLEHNGKNGAMFDFHHINPAEKEIGISKLTKSSWAKVKLELEKCVMVCSNCHRQIHSKEY